MATDYTALLTAINNLATQIKNNLDAIRDDIATINGRLDGLDTTTGNLNTSLQTVQGQVSSLETQVGILETSVQDLTGRVEALESSAG